ncbi:OmpA family protein [Psychrobacter sp. W2-37-MNA-CIBAN-0211]|uniref:OmpA family protein n=1 Tax=Psychrobacter sp. W2-37-MNA-CIBAN-0211 TaxID=3140443 RepID=UPI00332E53A6
MLASSIALAGCQTTTTAPSKDLPKDENIRTMQADIPDSDSDGVLDNTDECSDTPNNVVVDKVGCPLSVSTDVGHGIGGQVSFPMNSSQPYAEDIDSLKVFANINDKCLIGLDGNISKYENIESNKTLARDRAEYIASYLILNYQIDPRQIKTAYYGDERSKAPSDSYEDSKVNQRVDTTMWFDDNCKNKID